MANASMEEVRDVYLGKKRFAKGTKLLPVNFTEGALKNIFLQDIVGMSSREFKHHWVKKVFIERHSVHLMDNYIDIIELVREKKGAVAYLPVSWEKILQANFMEGTGEIKIIGP